MAELSESEFDRRVTAGIEECKRFLDEQKAKLSPDQLRQLREDMIAAAEKMLADLLAEEAEGG